MAEIKDIKEARRKRNSQKVIRRFLVFLVLIVVIFAAVLTKETVSRENITASVSDFFSSFGRGEGYPLTVPGSRTADIEAQGSSAAVLTQTQFMVYSSSGKQQISSIHGFSNPLMSVTGNRSLVFDRGGTGIKVFSKSKELFRKNFENTIYGAFMGKKYFAVITSSQSYSCELIIYTSTYKEVMKWYCSEGRVTAFSFDSGSGIYVSVVSAENGDFKTTVYKLNASKKTEEGSVSIPGMLALSMKKSGSGAEIIGQNKTVKVTKNLEVETVFEYGDRTLQCFENKDNSKTVLALSEGENDKANNIFIISSGKVEDIVLEVTSEVEAIDFTKKDLVYISEGKLYSYNFRTGKTAYKEVDIDTYSLSVSGNDVYVLGVTKISKFDDI